MQTGAILATAILRQVRALETLNWPVVAVRIFVLNLAVLVLLLVEVVARTSLLVTWGFVALGVSHDVVRLVVQTGGATEPRKMDSVFEVRQFEVLFTAFLRK